MWNRKSRLVSAFLLGISGAVLLGVGSTILPPMIVPGLFLILIGAMVFICASAEQTPLNYTH